MSKIVQGLWVAVSLVWLCGPAWSEDSATGKLDFDIQAQAVERALSEFAQTTGLQLIFPAEEIGSEVKAPAVTGSFTARDALNKLLAGTGLGFEFVNARTVTIYSGKEGEGGNDRTSEASSPYSSQMRVAQVDAAAAREGSLSTEQGSQQSAVDAAEQSQETKLEEITVTAQKRVERLQDVPVPVTALDAEVLVDSNQLRIQDYYTRIPGLSIATGDFHGAPQLAIRGLTTGGFSSPTVGVVVDDVPYGSSLGVTLGQEAPDIDPSELARVELLRGPQGTLYGASSMGGLLKFVTIDPASDRVSGRLQAGTSSVRNGDGLGYSVRGSVNVPLGDTWAVRASGFTRRDPGYIDNPLSGKEGINRMDVEGGRLSTLWRPSEAFSLKLSALLQDISADGSPEVHVLPGLGDLQQNALIGTGTYDKQIRVYSATVTTKLGGVDVAAISGYNISEFSDSIDYTRFRGAGALAQFGVSGAALQNHFKTSKFTQEIRLSAPIGERFEWLFGAFYDREKTDPRQQNMMAVDPATGAVAGALFFDATPNEFTEYAAFTDLTVHITDRFDVQFGGRYAEDKQSSYQIRTITAGGGIFIPEVETKENAFTYLVTPRLKLSDDLMMYARLASGYRPGGPNPNALVLGLPATFKPDETQNYEIGIKGSALDRRLSFDASLYYIDWKDMQLQLISPGGQGYFANAGGAKSQGVELSLETRPLTGMTVTAWTAFNDAVLTEDFPLASTARGESGDRLPVSSRFSGSLSLQQEFPVVGTATGFVGGSVSYVGEREGVFSPASSQRQIFPSYTKADLSAGVRYDSWTVNLFVNNIADKRGVLTGGLGTIHPTAFNYIQPRTVGLSLAMNF